MNFEEIDPDCHLEREQMSIKFKQSYLIFYICNTPEDLEYILSLNEDTIEMGKTRCDDDFYEMHIRLQKKVVLITNFYNNLPVISKTKLIFDLRNKKLSKFLIEHYVMKYKTQNYKRLLVQLHYIKLKIITCLRNYRIC